MLPRSKSARCAKPTCSGRNTCSLASWASSTPDRNRPTETSNAWTLFTTSWKRSGDHFPIEGGIVTEQVAAQAIGTHAEFWSKPRNDLRPKAQGFDEVRIFTVPRYKQSGLSGDEWRISDSIELWRKGKLIHERGVRNVEIGFAFASAVLYEAQDDGKAHFGGDGIHCDQEGCADAATVR